MSLHNSKVDALLSWVNTLQIDEPIADLSELSDGTVFVKLITKINGNEEEGHQVLQQPLLGKFEFICSFLQKHCRYGSTAECMVDWESLLQGAPSEMELSKVIVLLLYYSTMSLKKPTEMEELDYKTQAELASILRFIVENEEALCLNDNLANFLQKRALFPSSSSMDSSMEGFSPMFFRRRKPEVRFIDLHKVASTSTLSNYLTDSPSSPMSEVWHTPQFKMLRLKKQLTEERALRDEMEQEVTDNRKRVTEKDAQISILQQRIERLTTICEKQADQQEPTELLELQGKHESLLIRLHDTLKQCQDLKTEKLQNERKIDELSEQNGDLSYKVRDIVCRLAQSQKELDEISAEYADALHEWTLKETQMEGELRNAFGEKKGLEEEILILQGKISLLEDQLEKMAESATQGRGEVMGDILKLEALKQEVVELTVKMKELQDRISLLEQEKGFIQAELESEKAKFNAEKQNLNNLITNLQTSISEMAVQKAQLEQESQAQEERLTSQINALQIEISKLNDFVVQRDHEIQNLCQQVEEERKQRGQLLEDLQKQEQSAKESAEGFGLQVNSLTNTLKHTESRLADFTYKMENEARQMVTLTEAREKALVERDSALMMLDECKKGKDNEVGVLSQKILNLEEISLTWQAAAEELKREKVELTQKVQELDNTILDLIAKCQTLDTENETQRKAHVEAVELLKCQLRDEESQLKEYKQKLAHKELQAEENDLLKQKLLSTEENIKNVKDLLQSEKRTYAETLEERGKRISQLEDEIQKLSCRRAQDQEELVEEKNNCKRLEAQLKQLEVEYQDKSLSLQFELSQKAGIIADQELALEKLAIEVGSWRKQCEDARLGEAQSLSQLDGQIKVYKEDLEKVSQQLQAERTKLAELEVRTRQVTSEHREKQMLLEADLLKANALVKEKESEAQHFCGVVEALQQNFEVDKRVKAEVTSQLETDVKKMTEEIDNLSRELSKERLEKVELQAERTKLAELEVRTRQVTSEHREKQMMLEAELLKANVLVKEKESEVQHFRGVVESLQQNFEVDKRVKAEVISQLETDVKKMTEEIDNLSRELSKERLEKVELQTERTTLAELEVRTRQVTSEHREKQMLLEADLLKANALVKEKESEAQHFRGVVESLQQNFEVDTRVKAEVISQLETDVKKMTEEIDNLSRKLSNERLEKVELESTLKKHEEGAEKCVALESKLSNTVLVIKEKELEAEKLSCELQLLQTSMQEIQRKHEHELALKDGDIKKLIEDKEHTKADLATETASKIAAVAQLEQSIQEQKDELSAVQNELTRSIQLITEKEGQVNKMTADAAITQGELKTQREEVKVLQEEVATMEALKEQMSKQESEMEIYIERTTTEKNSLQAVISEKDKEMQCLEEKIHQQAQENSSIQGVHQQKLSEISTLHSKVRELECKCGEQQEVIGNLQKAAGEAKLAAAEGICAAEHQRSLLQALETEVVHLKEKNSEWEKLLEASTVAQSEQESTIRTLRSELLDKAKELENSEAVVCSVKEELSSMCSQTQEMEKSSDSLKSQLTACLQEVETKNSVICALEQELAAYRLRISEVEEDSVQLKRLNDQEYRKNEELEEQMKRLQSETVSVTVIAEKNELLERLQQEVDDFKERTEKQMLCIEELKKQLSTQKELKEELHLEVSTWQERHLQKEEQKSALQQELASAQRFVGELMTMKNLHLEQQAQLSVVESKCRAELEHQQKTVDSLQFELQKATSELEHQQKAVDSLKFELKKATSEVADLHLLKDRCSQQELVVMSLQAENASIQVQVCKLQHSNLQLLEKNKILCEEVSQGKKSLDDDLTNTKEQHAQELEELKSDYQKLVADLKEKVHDASKKLEVMTIKYDDAKMKVLDERQKFHEERQKLLSQVELLEVSKSEHAKQLEELNKKWSQQETITKSQQQKLNVRESEFQEEVQHQKELLLELHTQLAQEQQSVQHYKAQFEKAKVHYDAKKQHNLELSAELELLAKVQEELEKENTDLKLEQERLKKELQYTLLQAQDSEQSCKNLTSKVCSLEAQLSFADRQLRELGKFQVATDAFKSRDTLCAPMNTRHHRNQADVSTDSLDLSDDDGNPLDSTRKNGRSHHETASSAAVTGSLESIASKHLPRKVESLESLYFTPIPNRVQSKLESSIGSLGELSIDSSQKTRSARRRTTQVINITMTKKIEEEPNSANTSFYSLRSAPSHPVISQQHSRPVSRPQAAASVPSLVSFQSQESLGNLSASSEDNLGHSVLMSLPGYKPATRSSKRLSQASCSTGTTSRNSFYVGSGQDEPDPLEDFSRIAELQQRNRVCPPHLKTSYPLESRTTVASCSITDEEMKTGDPRETLRRSTMLPSQIQATISRRMTLAPSTLATRSGSSNIATRQQLKRTSEESHQGPDTPESKKSSTCFPRPMTPKDANRRKLSTLDSKKESQQQANRRQSMSFSILNTPKKITNSLLRRGLGKKTPTSKNSPRGSSSSSSSSTSTTSTKSPHNGNKKSPLRKSPRIASTKSPRMHNKIFERKQPKNRKA